MDKRRFKTKTNTSRRTTTTDGFIRANPASSASGMDNTRRRGAGPDFKAADGFHPVRPTAPLERPVARRTSTGRNPRRNTEGKIDLLLPDAAPKTSFKKLSGKSWPRVAMKTFSTILIAGVLVTGYIAGKGYLKAREIFKGGTAGAAGLQENVDPTALNGEGDGRVNILLLGKGGPGHDAPDLTDTILVASIDPIQYEASLLSIPRDLWVSSDQGNTKINAVYANAKYAVLNGAPIENQEEKAEEAGFNAIESAVEQSMGIPIHYHMMIDFKGFERAVDTVGGVEIDVSEPLYEVMHINGQQYILNVQTGRQSFDGFKALAYSRSRMTSRRGDFDRTERQRQMLIGLKDRIFSLGTLANPKTVSDLLSDFGDNMTSNLSLNEVMRLYEIGSKIDGSKISSIGLADPPNDFVHTANIGGQSVVVPRAGISDFSEIQSFVRNTLKDAFIRDEDATIAIYNGTNIGGLAGTKATDLRSYGYNVTTVADAPTKGYVNTILVDLTGGEKKYTKAYLEKRLNTSAATSMSDNTIATEGIDFVIILGQNESSNF